MRTLFCQEQDEPTTLSCPKCCVSLKLHAVMQEDLNILGPVGEGAFGAVSLAHSPIFGKVATKWLKPGKVSTHVIMGSSSLLASIRVARSPL